MPVIVLILFGYFILNKNNPKEDSDAMESSTAVPIEKVEQDRGLTEDNQIPKDNIAEQVSVIKPAVINKPAVKEVKKISVQTEKIQDNLAPLTTPQYGCLNLRTNPPWTKVYIDEIFIGETPKTGIIQLKTGSHKLVVVKTGFNQESFYVSILPNDTLHKKIKMTPSGKTKE